MDNNGDGQIDTGDTLVGANGEVGPGVDLSGGKAHKLLVKVFAPGGATAGTTDTATVTVTFPTRRSAARPRRPTSPPSSRGQMRLIKLQAKDENCDGAEGADLVGGTHREAGPGASSTASSRPMKAPRR